MILVFGSLNLDHTCLVKNLPRPGETVLGETLIIAPGGKGANQAYNAAKMGADTIFIAAHGNDHHAEKALSNLQKVGVRTNLCSIKCDVPTGFAMISLMKRGKIPLLLLLVPTPSLRQK